MAKIYSRPRIRLPKKIVNNTINKKKLEKVVQILLIFIIAIGVAKYILDAVDPIFDTLCEAKSKSIAVTVLNEQTNNVMKQYAYDDLFTIERDSNNKITMIKSNTTNINMITTKIALNVQQEIDNRGREDISIALRKLYGNEIIIRKRSRCKN